MLLICVCLVGHAPAVLPQQQTIASVTIKSQENEEKLVETMGLLGGHYLCSTLWLTGGYHGGNYPNLASYDSTANQDHTVSEITL